MSNIQANLCLQTHLNLLKRHSLWPKDSSKPITLGDCIYITCLYWGIGVIFFLGYIHFYFSLRGDASIDITDDLVLLAETAFLGYMFLMFLVKINNIISLVEEVKCFEKFGKPKNLDDVINKQNIYMKILYTYTYLGIGIYAAVTYLEKESCERKNDTSYCGLIIPLWLPYGIIDIFLVKVAFVVVDAIAMAAVLLPSTTGTYLKACIIELITIRVTHLRMLLQEISTITSEREKKARLVLCIKYHIYLIRMTGQVVNCFRGINAIHYSLSSIIIGILYFKIVQTFSFKDIIHLNGWIFSMFILCYTGQELKNESSSLSNDLYCLKWYEMDVSFRPYIKLMIMKMQNPLCISTAIFFSYSHEFMLRLLQTSYTYMTIAHEIWSNRNK